MEATIADGAARPTRTFFGEPRGLAYLAFTEAWERFSYYGMTALLTLYMTKQLFLPGHIENVVGFGEFRHLIEGKNAMTPVALGSAIFGMYTGFVYLTPIIGGAIADRWIGRRNAVVLGAILMSAGHIAMAFDQSFLLALFLLILGVGFLKGNISTQVGQLYAEGDAAGRSRGFAIFSTGINVGAVVGPLACGALEAAYGFHWGFGLAGILMLLGLITYLIGYRELSEQQAAAATPAAVASQQPETAGRTWKIIAALVAVMAISIFQSIGYYQNSNIALIWIDQHVDLQLLPFFKVPTEWFNSIDSFVSIISVPPLLMLWRWQGKHGGAPNVMMKIATGAVLCCAGNLLLAASATGERTNVIFPIVYNILQGVAFIYYWPTMLALVSDAAPLKLKSTMMGVAFLTLFVSNNTIGFLGRFYEPLGPVQFWLLHAGIAAVGAALAIVFGGMLTRALEHHRATR